MMIGWILARRRRSNVDYQRWYKVGKQLAQPYSDCGKSNFPTVDVQGLSSVYSALLVDLKYQCLYNVGCKTGPTLFRLWKK